MKAELYVLANSPGELSGWVAPVVAEYRRLQPAARITVALIPDWFTSGRERQFAEALSVDRVVGVFTLIGELWPERGREPATGALVLFLGGDALYAKLLAWLLRCPAMAYMPRVYRPHDFVKIFVPSEAERQRGIAKGGDPGRIVVVPTLALDSIRPSAPLPELREHLELASGGGPVVSLLAGSRPEYAKLGFGFLLEVAEMLLAACPSGYVMLPVSPFLDRRLAGEVLAERRLAYRQSLGGDILFTGPDGRIRFVFGNSHDVLAVSDLAAALPGTNNLQCAALGTPFLVMMPLNWIEYIPFEGLLGFLYPKFFPFNHLKKFVISYLSARISFLSMVNRTAGRMIAPEIRAVITPRMIADALLDLWRDEPRRTGMKADLQELTRERGAARIIAEAMHEISLSDQRLR